MTGLIILLIVGFAAIAVLLACLKGFSQARRYKKVEGAFVDIERNKGRIPERRNRALLGSSDHKAEPHKEPVGHQVCARTAALVEMAIILGSRNVCYSASGSGDPKGARVRKSPGFRHKRDDAHPAVQPLNNS